VKHVTSGELRLYFFIKPFVSRNCETIICVWVVRKFETKGTGQVCSCTCQEDTQEKRSYSSTHAMCQTRYTGHDRGSRHGHYHAKRHRERRTLQTIYFAHNMPGRAATLYMGCSGHLITIRRLLFIKPNCSASSQCLKRDSRFRNNRCFHSGKTDILYQCI